MILNNNNVIFEVISFFFNKFLFKFYTQEENYLKNKTIGEFIRLSECLEFLSTQSIFLSLC